LRSFNPKTPVTMSKLMLLSLFLLISTISSGQGIELFDFQIQHKAGIGESISIPINTKNTAEKPIYLVIQELSQTMGGTQKHHFCLDNTCLETEIKEYHRRLEPGEKLGNFYVKVEAGLVPGSNSINYRIFNKNNPSEFTDIEIQLLVEEKLARHVMYQNNKVTVNEIYPNPVQDAGYVDYQIHQDGVKAQVYLINVLGNIVSEYNLSPYERRLKLKTEDLSPGIYFLTFYVDQENVLSRKLIVRK
jgi:hypothetical protein